MNPAELVGRLRAGFTKNKALVGVLGVAAVAALAWQARSSKGETPETPESVTSSGSPYSTGQQLDGYDSTSSDVYNALQPEIERLGDLLEGWDPKTIPVPPPGAPAPTPSTPATSAAIAAAAKKVGAARLRFDQAQAKVRAAVQKRNAAKTEAARRAAEKAVQSAERAAVQANEAWQTARADLARLQAGGLSVGEQLDPKKYPEVAGTAGLLPHVVTAARIIAAQVGITRVHGFSYRYIHGTKTLSDHAFGTAVDFPCTQAQGEKLAAFVTANATGMNVKYVIWWQRIWYPGKGWEQMEDRGSVSQNHKDHVHVSFNLKGAPNDAGGGGLSWSDLGDPYGLGQKLGDKLGDKLDVGGLLAGTTWGNQAVLVGVKIAAVLAGLGLVVLGANRLVTLPAAQKTLEAVT